MDDHYFMHTAYQEAVKAFDEGEVPVGAVIEKGGAIIGRGYNRMENLPDATAHAEIIAISAASSKLSSWRLSDCTLYVTLEPCLMCLGAIMQARIGKIVYGATDSRFGAVDSHYYKQEIQRTYGYCPVIISGIMESDCSSLLTSFFSRVRKKS